ncbi:Ribosome maturation factor RimM [Candidatus Propionivibrio aalborgensis]|uniref:Ribosome maturation factor RimM n=1 Tax=Candidatus Propionivibrio aalborgensis TaxID=1860101 RepID=A0A1A8XPN3_9RHOO|nr:Ribosome maturation factor RimM [Candidatus Propionivibrio aalborgensis]
MQAERTIDNLLPESVGVVTPADIVVLGKIVGPYGLRGAVKVHPFADDPSHWARLPYWWIGQEGSAPGLWRQTRLLKCNLRGDLLVAELDCLPDRDASEAARGVLVGVPRADLPPAAKGEYYWADLIGLDVINTRGTVLGQVLGLIETPANDVLRVGDGVKVEQLLPFVATVVLDVDVASRKVCVDWESDW